MPEIPQIPSLPASFYINFNKANRQNILVYQKLKEKFYDTLRIQYDEEYKRFTESISTQFGKEDGIWEAGVDCHFWRTRIASEEGNWLSLSLDKLNIQSNATIWVYSPDGIQINGPYTLQDIFKENLHIAPIEGLELILEVNVPDSENIDNISWNVKKVSLGHKPIYDKVQLGNGCEKHVNCIGVGGIENQIRSTVYIITDRNNGTGTLIRSLNEKGGSYVITSGHVVQDWDDASDARFYWNFERKDCQNETQVTLSEMQVGATLVARNVLADISLLKLDHDPSPEYNVFYSGWNRSNDSATNVFCIHHPNGRPKSYCASDGSLISTASNDTFPDVTKKFWMVTQWNFGSTANKKSSGAGLWTRDGFLKGCLRLGDADCNGPDGPDWFSKLSTVWRGDPGESLGKWLGAPNDDVDETVGIDGPREIRNYKIFKRSKVQESVLKAYSEFLLRLKQQSQLDSAETVHDDTSVNHVFKSFPDLGLTENVIIQDIGDLQKLQVNNQLKERKAPIVIFLFQEFEDPEVYFVEQSMLFNSISHCDNFNSFRKIFIDFKL